MITIDDIKKLISKNETRTLELKKTTGELHKGMETACAFLNSDGGWLIFGIAPSLKIDGQNVIDTPSHTLSDEESHPQSRLISPQDKVFTFCKSPKSIAEIADILGEKDRKWVRKKYIVPFIETKLQMTIPDKPNSQNQKYQTIE